MPRSWKPSWLAARRPGERAGREKGHRTEKRSEDGTGDAARERERRSLDADDVDGLWSGARRLTAAVVLALFPVLFILDRLMQTTLSPVLPGLVLLALLIVLLPIGAVEPALPRVRRLPEEERGPRVRRLHRAARRGLNASVAWLAAWILLGL